MAQVAAKNFNLTPAATSLGLGDQLQLQAQDVEDENRKRALQNQGVLAGATSPAFNSLMGNAV